jgi:hypothetical protein
METPASPADELPALYREILDGLAPLERGPYRAEALRIRARASRVYAQSWSEAGRRSLQNLLRQIQRLSSRRDRADATGAASAAGRWRPRRGPVATR